MTTKRTKKQKCSDLFDAFKCIQRGEPVKRSGTKDGSIPTHPVVEVMPLKEKDVLAECLTWFRINGILCWRHECGGGDFGSGYAVYGMKSGGDIIGLLKNGIHFEIEIKRGKGGRLSAGQQKRMREVQSTNGLYFVIHGLSELKYFMGKHV